MSGDYRVTATWVATGTWLLHVEQMDERPGSRGVKWWYQDELLDLDGKVASVVGRAQGRPPISTLVHRFVLPSEIHELLQQASQFEGHAGWGPAGLARARRLRTQARHCLLGHGVALADVERVLRVEVAGEVGGEHG